MHSGRCEAAVMAGGESLVGKAWGVNAALPLRRKSGHGRRGSQAPQPPDLRAPAVLVERATSEEQVHDAVAVEVAEAQAGGGPRGHGERALSRARAGVTVEQIKVEVRFSRGVIGGRFVVGVADDGDDFRDPGVGTVPTGEVPGAGRGREPGGPRIVAAIRFVAVDREVGGPQSVTLERDAKELALERCAPSAGLAPGN